MKSPDYNEDFWNWVASRRAHDNPRGDFIRDTSRVLSLNKSPNDFYTRISSNEVAMEELDKLWKKYPRKKFKSLC